MVGVVVVVCEVVVGVDVFCVKRRGPLWSGTLLARSGRKGRRAGAGSGWCGGSGLNGSTEVMGRVSSLHRKIGIDLLVRVHRRRHFMRSQAIFPYVFMILEMCLFYD